MAAKYKRNEMARICKVLIVENDNGVRDLLANMVEDEGYLFATVETGREMRGALDEDDYDIVIIDVTQPPPEDGFALARVAREQGCGVILTTGNPPNFERLRGSGEHYLLKPFRIREFTALVDKILTEVAAQCVRRKRSDGSLFASRTG
jgi:DNA-binding response OmpR family regulator